MISILEVQGSSIAIMVINAVYGYISHQSYRLFDGPFSNHFSVYNALLLYSWELLERAQLVIKKEVSNLIEFIETNFFL